jgi:hypothetical protein
VQARRYSRRRGGREARRFVHVEVRKRQLTSQNQVMTTMPIVPRITPEDANAHGTDKNPQPWKEWREKNQAARRGRWCRRRTHRDPGVAQHLP